MQGLTHYEVFGRRPNGALNLEHSLESESRALQLADSMWASREFVAIKVVRETRDPETGEFKSAVIRKEGDFSAPAPRRATGASAGPACKTGADLYGPHARVRIAEHLAGWLGRKTLTAFELLHRLDQADALRNAGGEYQHAIQKFAVPESLARGASVHEVIRSLHTLIDEAAGNLRSAQKAGRILPLSPAAFAAVCDALAKEEDRIFLVSAAVAGWIGKAATWAEKVDRVLTLAESAPKGGPGRDLAMFVLAQPLGEMLALPAVLDEVLGGELDLGGRLAATARMLAPEAIEALAAADPAAAAQVPPATEAAARAGRVLADPRFESLRGLIGKRLLAEISGQKRLRPADAEAEIELVRALAAALSLAAGKQMPADAVREAFAERSAAMVGAEFVTAYLSAQRTAMDEALALTRLLESAVGQANKRQAARWLQSCLTGLKFDTEINSAAVPASDRLALLAQISRRAARAGRDVAGVEPLLQTLGEIGGRIEAEGKVIAQMLRLPSPVHRLQGLIRMANGETAPRGPASERAHKEARKVMNAPETTHELSRDPRVMHQVQTMMRALEGAA